MGRPDITISPAQSPSYEGSGLKYSRHMFLASRACVSPSHEGSGLSQLWILPFVPSITSPSHEGEWIEIVWAWKAKKNETNRTKRAFWKSLKNPV